MTEKLNITLDQLPPAPDAKYDAVLGVFKGEPWVNNGVGGYMYGVPDVPYVHSAFVTTQSDSGEVSRSPEPVNLLVAHGVRGSAGQWTFKDGRSVKGFIDTYNANNPCNAIQVAAVCNPTKDFHDGVQHAVMSEVGVSAYKEGNDTVVGLSVKDPAAGYMYVPAQQKTGP